MGDLNISKRVSVIQIRCSTTIPAQIKLIRSLFAPYTTPHVTTAKRGTYEIVCLVNRSFNFLLCKEDKIPAWISGNKKYFFSFLAGYSDAEGCFYLKKPKKCSGTWTSGFEVQTQQKTIICELWKNIQKYRIFSPSPKISVRAGHINNQGNRNNKDMWRFVISKKESLWKFINLIKPYMKHGNKIKKITKIKENIIVRNSIPYSHQINLS